MTHFFRLSKPVYFTNIFLRGTHSTIVKKIPYLIYLALNVLDELLISWNIPHRTRELEQKIRESIVFTRYLENAH